MDHRPTIVKLWPMQAVILAGGRGNRLSKVTGGLPKALVDIAGKPLLHRQLELLAHHGFTRIVLLVCHGSEHIRASCGDGNKFGVTIDYVIEDEPRGTAGAVLAVLDRLDASFAVLYGDTVLNVDLARMYRVHVESGADATLFVHPNDHPYDSDIVETDSRGRIVAFHSPPHSAGRALPNIVNAALHILETRCLRSVDLPLEPFDFGKQLFPLLLGKGWCLRAYHSREYIKDAGTPDRLANAVIDVKSGRVANGSLMTSAVAVFLDRDGTLNEDSGYIASPNQLHLLPNVAQAIRQLNQSRYLSVLVTNQPIIARGGIDEAGLQRIHNHLERLLANERAYVDGIYYCPHHPDRGFPGERPEYKIVCGCRKPATGLVDQAKVDMNIDPASSWMIGNSFVDVELARRAGLLSVLLGSANGDGDARFAHRPDFEFGSFREAVDFILQTWASLAERASTISSGLEPGDVVLIGGLGRSGKSSFASALAWHLRNRGTSTKVVSLDGWLKPFELRRNDDTIIDRFDIKAIERSLQSTVAAPASTLTVPLYNRMLRRSDKQYTIDVAPSDIVIVEGVVALMLTLINVRRTIRIFVCRDETRRYESLAADYRARRFTTEDFERLYAERQQNETPYILKTRDRADIIVKTP
jgi:D,D-heptose 1,7-bisphosphate phosphatase